MTGKARFEQDVIALIERENRRRKIGKGYVLAHVVQIANRLSGARRWEQVPNTANIGGEGRPASGRTSPPLGSEVH